MAEPWQYIPDEVIQTEQNREAATNWATMQRARIAQDWGDMQRQSLNDLWEEFRAKLNEGIDFAYNRLPQQAEQGINVGPAMELLKEKVQQPALEAATYLGSRGIEGTSPFENNPEQLGEAWRARDESFPGLKGGIEMATDPINLIPMGGVAKIAKAGIKGGLSGVAKAAEEAVKSPLVERLAPGLGVKAVESELPRTVTKGFAKKSGAYLGELKRATLDLIWDRNINVIRKQGEPGKELSNKVNLWRESWESYAGQLESEISTIKKLTEEQFNSFIDVVQDKAKSTDDLVNTAVKEWNKVSEEIYTRAKAAGIDVKYLKNYFPHMFDPKVLGDRNKQEIIYNSLINSGKKPDEALEIMRFLKDTARDRTFANLQHPRYMNIPEYRRDKAVLFEYIEGTAKSIAQREILGEKDQIAMNLLRDIGKAGFDEDAARKAFDVSVGATKYDPLAMSISNKVRVYNVLTKLGLGAISNSPQSINTATVTGVRRTLGLALKAARLSPEDERFVTRAGTILDETIREVRDVTGYNWGAPGFNIVEKFNRVLASLAGREFARDMAKQALKGDKRAIKALDNLGLDSKAIIARDGVLTELDEITAARNVVQRTQFKVSPMDLPYWTSSPFGRMVMQFRTYSYNQTAFVAREILEPAIKERDVRPLARYVLLSLPVGAGIMETKNAITGREREQDPLKYTALALVNGSGIGLAGDVIRGLSLPNANYMPGTMGAVRVAGTLGGPTVGSVLRGASAAYELASGKPEEAVRFGLAQIPVAGPAIQNRLVPYESKKNSSPNYGRSSRSSNTRNDVSRSNKTR